MNREQECYGKMFPSVVEMAHNSLVTGKVFGYEVDYPGQVAHKRDTTDRRPRGVAEVFGMPRSGWLLSAVHRDDAHGTRSQDYAPKPVLTVRVRGG
jgi:hypothetical protein